MGLKVSTTCELTFGGRRTRRRLAGRRGARRHRADVQGHRVRPDDGRHQGDRHPVDRLPQRARLREDPRAGRRPHPDDRQDRAARDDHPPPRRAPLADDAEGLRRGHARADALHRLDPGRRRRQARTRARTPTLDERLNDLLLPIVKGFGSEKSYALHRPGVAADLRRLRLPAGLPDRAVHPRRQDRHPLRGHHGHPGHGLVLPQDRPRQGAGPHQAAHRRAGVRQGRRRQRHPRRPSATCWPRRSRTSRAWSAPWSAS